MMLRTLIVDDERLARERLRRLLSEDPEIEVVGDCADGESAIAAVKELQPHLLLLDVKMPRMDGFEVVEIICQSELPIVIFVTAFNEHAVRAFDTCAVDYLLKPVSAPRLEKALARAREQLRNVRGAQPAQAASTGNGTLRFHVRCGQRTSFVAPEEIDWIEASGNYAILHVGAQNHLLRATMASLEKSLPDFFLRTSRSAILNLRRVKALEASGGNQFALMPENARAPVTIGVRTVQQRLREVNPLLESSAPTL